MILADLAWIQHIFLKVWEGVCKFLLVVEDCRLKLVGHEFNLFELAVVMDEQEGVQKARVADIFNYVLCEYEIIEYFT